MVPRLAKLWAGLPEFGLLSGALMCGSKEDAVTRYAIIIVVVELVMASIPFAMPAQAQVLSQTIQPRDEHVVTALPNRGQLGPIECSEDGAMIYFRQFQAAAPMRSPVIRITTDGSNYRMFRIDNIPDLPDKDKFTIADFGIVGSHVDVLGQAKDTTVIVDFDGDAEVERLITLDNPFSEPIRMLPFKSGNFLIAGARRPEPQPKKGTKIEIDVDLYDASGRFIKNVHLAGADGTDKNPMKQFAVRDSMSLSGIGVEGDTGYILPKSSDLLYIVSASGNVRTMKVRRLNEKDAPEAIRVSSGRILVQYERAGDTTIPSIVTTFVEYDANTGEILREYLATQSSGTFACFDWQTTFTAIGEHNGVVRIISSEAR